MLLLQSSTITSRSFDLAALAEEEAEVPNPVYTDPEVDTTFAVAKVVLVEQRQQEEAGRQEVVEAWHHTQLTDRSLPSAHTVAAVTEAQHIHILLPLLVVRPARLLHSLELSTSSLYVFLRTSDRLFLRTLDSVDTLFDLRCMEAMSQKDLRQTVYFHVVVEGKGAWASAGRDPDGCIPRAVECRARVCKTRPPLPNLESDVASRQSPLCSGFPSLSVVVETAPMPLRCAFASRLLVAMRHVLLLGLHHVRMSHTQSWERVQAGMVAIAMPDRLVLDCTGWRLVVGDSCRTIAVVVGVLLQARLVEAVLHYTPRNLC